MDEASFPQFQRIMAFLNGCGLYSYTLQFVWFEQNRYLYYPFTARYRPFAGGRLEASDKAMLQQYAQASLERTIPIGEVFSDSNSYRLELDHGLYRLRYSLTGSKRRQLIRRLLAEKGIVQYELLDETDEGCLLPADENFSDIEDCSGTVVTLTKVYGFWLDWTNGRYTLGDGSTFQYGGKERSYWYEYPPEMIRPHGRFPGFEPAVEGARRRLRLRWRVEAPEAEQADETWELREEEVKHV